MGTAQGGGDACFRQACRFSRAHRHGLLTVPRLDSESRKPLKSLLEAERHEHRAREEAAIDLATNCTHDDMSEVPSDDRIVAKRQVDAARVNEILAAEARSLERTWMPACGFSFSKDDVQPGDDNNAPIGARVPITIWKCTVPGIDGTVMEGGLFSFHLKFPIEYPAEPPVYSLDKKQKTAFEFFQDATKRS